MQDKGFGDNEIKDSFEKLGAADYLKNNPHNLDEALLTEKGEKLKSPFIARVIYRVLYQSHPL